MHVVSFARWCIASPFGLPPSRRRSDRFAFALHVAFVPPRPHFALVPLPTAPHPTTQNAVGRTVACQKKLCRKTAFRSAKPSLQPIVFPANLFPSPTEADSGNTDLASLRPLRAAQIRLRNPRSQ